MKVYAVELPLAPCARMINGGTTMRSISWGRLEAERWSVFLYWTLHSHSKPWPGLQWFITGAVFWSLTFSTLPWLQKSGFHCQLKSRKRDSFKNLKGAPQVKDGEPEDDSQNCLGKPGSNKEIKSCSVSNRKKIIHGWTSTAFFLTELKQRSQICPNKFCRGTREKPLYLIPMWMCGRKGRKTTCYFWREKKILMCIYKGFINE